MLDWVLVVSGTSSHNLHSIFITHTQTVTSSTVNPLLPHDVSSRAGRKKMAARGGIEGKDRPSNQAPDACIIP